MSILLLILGIILIVSGVLGVLRGQLLWGIVAIVVGVILTPGGFVLGL
ncbi:GPGG-motif small membrane protein [Nocardiopsis metallicus]|uniref:Putative membrane protein n=1 Tax=Nocardiopsis metallicus TaxID=179819 RepID=A0A840WHV7_9ACTN|nr:GPGG-motif small membrane protein [Nocardiopsis metallicus]MBB5489658.1 putative membrane protein [Nocardiopsis metallicus]